MQFLPCGEVQMSVVSDVSVKMDICPCVRQWHYQCAWNARHASRIDRRPWCPGVSSETEKLEGRQMNVASW